MKSLFIQLLYIISRVFGKHELHYQVLHFLLNILCINHLSFKQLWAIDSFYSLSKYDTFEMLFLTKIP